MKVKLTNVRLSFPDLFTARPFKPGDKPKFKASFLIPKNDPQIKDIEAAIKATALNKWGAKADGILKTIRGNPNKFCYQDGNNKTYEGYEDMMVVSASNAVRPLVLDADKSPLTEADGRPYAGCYVNASIEFFPYENSGNGISASLKGVQFCGKGDSFGGGSPADPDDFDSIDAPAEGGDLL